uniref:Uncharacterized protein n=1 Tax=Wuchereria bancrofti TaxID=6293 RepID=A0AAF5Q1P9_WUCBA
MSLIKQSIQFIIFIIFHVTVKAIICFHCHSEFGTCNSGMCEGNVCIKMEASNRINVKAIICFHCHSEFGTCNSGMCEGNVCIKMEASNRINGRRTVRKGCGKKYEQNGCQQTFFGTKWTSRCVCDQMMCNNDEILTSLPE